MKLLLSYLLLINLIGFVLMGEDKKKAQLGARRTPERVLLLAAALGGSAGVWAGMYSWRHKTQKRKFTLGVPAIFAAQLASAVSLKLLFFP